MFDINSKFLTLMENETYIGQYCTGLRNKFTNTTEPRTTSNSIYPCDLLSFVR